MGTPARRLARLASALLGGGGRSGPFSALVGVAVALLVLLPLVSGLLAGRVGALVGFAAALVVLLAMLGFAALGLVGRQVANLGGQQQVLATNLRLVIEQAEALAPAPTSLIWRSGSSGGNYRRCPLWSTWTRLKPLWGRAFKRR